MIVDTILDYKPRQLSIDELLAEIEAENRDMPPQIVGTSGQQGAPKSLEIGSEPHNGLCPGTPVSHADYPDFRGVYVGPGRRPGLALVRVTAGWLGGELPTWPVSIPYLKLVEV